MKILIGLAVVLILVGLNLLYRGHAMPVYTDPAAPGRLSVELQDLPREQRFSSWYSRLKEYETGHKHFTDQGRGLIALGVGLLGCGCVWSGYRRSRGGWRTFWFAAAWVAAWAVRVPLSFWYYSVRQERFDYPAWGDSIVIGIFNDSIFSALGLFFSSAVVAMLMAKREWPDPIVPRRAETGLARVRAAVLCGWILLLAVGVAEGVMDGDEGSVLSCCVRIPLLWILLCAPMRPAVEVRKED